MAQPVWITEAGSLGTVEEGKFFQLPLQAYDPDYPDDKTKVYYLMIAGDLPDGIRCGPSGLIEGIPKAVSSLQGVPSEVGENITSKFTVRVYTEREDETVDEVNDRTFTLTVTGQDLPEFVTPAGLIATQNDGDFVNLQIEFTDEDPDDEVVAYIAGGSLPPGLTMSTTGLISGYIDPTLESNAVAGWDKEGTPWNELPWDFITRYINKNYQFTVKITDGKDYRLRTFEIYVYDRRGMTADYTEITADNGFITADASSVRQPFVRNYDSNLGSYRHDNFYAYQIKGVDIDGDEIEYAVVSGILPPGLDIDSATGWLVGYISNIGLRNLDYEFTVRVRKVSSPNIYRDFNYSISIYGNIDTDVTWLTESDLGTVDNGDTSLLSIQAVHSQGIALNYRLKSGSDSKLPQGLQLLPSGNISGRVSYKTFALDAGTTTFDKELRTRLDINETTFDMKFDFVVEAYNPDEIVNVSKSFTVTVIRRYNQPCQCLRIEAFPPDDDRALVNTLIQNQDIFKPEWLYRGDDPWFGIRPKIWYEHAYGLNASEFAAYTDAIITNHYRKRLILGELKTARALDDNDNVLYEVVYSDVIDGQLNNQGESAARSVKLKYPINAGDSTEIDTIYPNSLTNMQTVIIDAIGQVAPILPRWMLSKQEDGTIPGFTRAWVIAYTIPGKSKELAYRINRDFGIQLNRVDFDVDRYVLGWYSANQWNPATDEWNESRQTTFDRTINDPPDPDDETYFDGGGTRFITNIDLYEYTDAYDKYVIFPQRYIIEINEE